MEPTTLRISEELRDELDREADAAGFSSRSDYIRYLLANRTAITHDQSLGTEPNTIDTETITEIETRLTTLGEKVSELEDRIHELEADTRLDNDTSVSETTDDSSAVGGTDDRATEVLENWLETDGPDSEAAREVIRDAAQILSEEGALGTVELRDRLFDRNPDAYGSADTLWTATIDRFYEEAPGFKKPERGVYQFKVDDQESVENSQH